MNSFVITRSPEAQLGPFRLVVVKDALHSEKLMFHTQLELRKPIQLAEFHEL